MKSVRRIRYSEASFIARGGERGQLHIVAPWCIRPVPVQIAARTGKSLPDYVRNAKGNMQMVTNAELNVGAACRRCDGCLEHKRKLWGARAYQETLLAPRTWFGTLTFRPELHDEALRAAMLRAWEDGLDFGRFTDGQQTHAMAAVLYGPVQRFIKRLRKMGYRFRYLLVAEPHESGLVHFHVLLHEITTHQTPKAKLEGQWRAGLSHWRLVQTGDPRAVWYVCKYLAKESAAKPRSSSGYGAPSKVRRSRSDRPKAIAPMQSPTGDTEPNREENPVDTDMEEKKGEG